MTLNQQPT